MNIEQIIKAIDDWKVNESSFRLGLYEYGVYKGDEILSFELEVYANEGSQLSPTIEIYLVIITNQL